MIVGIGVDVVEVARFRATLDRTPGMAERLFTPTERHTNDGSPRTAASLAARFAAKEAVAKALGAPGGLEWHDCQVLTDLSGRPTLLMTGSVAAESAKQGIGQWHLSLSHDGDVAAASVVAESVQGERHES